MRKLECLRASLAGCLMASDLAVSALESLIIIAIKVGYGVPEDASFSLDSVHRMSGLSR